MRSFSATILLIIFSVSVFGVSVELHYCGDRVTSISFFGNAGCICDHDEEKSCHKNEASPKHCHDSKKDQNNNDAQNNCSKGDCCKTEWRSFLLKTSFLNNAENSCKSWVHVFLNDESVMGFSQHFIAKKDHLQAHYLPPLLSRDIPVLIASFLI